MVNWGTITLYDIENRVLIEEDNHANKNIDNNDVSAAIDHEDDDNDNEEIFYTKHNCIVTKNAFSKDDDTSNDETYNSHQ